MLIHTYIKTSPNAPVADDYTPVSHITRDKLFLTKTRIRIESRGKHNNIASFTFRDKKQIKSLVGQLNTILKTYKEK